jgi:Undecaprenyl-phosphate glucose phosphotransferase
MIKPNEARLSVVERLAIKRFDANAGGPSAPGQTKLPRRLPVSYRDIAQFAIVLDVALILSAALLGEALTAELRPSFQLDSSRELAAAVFVAVLFVTSLRMRDIYEPMALMNWGLQLRAVLGAWCGAFLIFASGLFAWRIGETVSRIDLVLFWSVGGLALLVHRAAWLLILPTALKTGGLRPRRTALLCFTGVEPDAVSSTLRSYGNSVSLLAVVSRTSEGRNLETRVDELVAAIRGQDIDDIFVAADLADAVRLQDVSRRFRVLPQPVTLLPVGALRELMKQRRADLGSTVAVEMRRAPLSQFELALKRMVDIVGAVAGVVLLSPLLVATSIAIRLDSPGPILFRQTRHGFNGRPFKIYKFRTMHVLEDGALIPQATASDPRVTRVGRFLRRFSIDELPQLLNVLSGEMSIVGPRPHASAHDKHFSEILEKYAFRQHVKAGMTGWAQVQGARGETDKPEKMQQRVDLDIWYINHWSLWFDLYIILQTARIVLIGENAN